MATNRKWVTFEFKADPGLEVYVAGTFNEWKPNERKLREKKGSYITRLLLSPGRHEYKFIINGQWHIDPECHDFVPNESGSLNSVLIVG